MSCRSVNLPARFPGLALSSKWLTSTCAHSFAGNKQRPFLNQRKDEHDCRNYFMINLHENYVAELGFVLATPTPSHPPPTPLHPHPAWLCSQTRYRLRYGALRFSSILFEMFLLFSGMLGYRLSSTNRFPRNEQNKQSFSSPYKIFVFPGKSLTIYLGLNWSSKRNILRPRSYHCQALSILSI